MDLWERILWRTRLPLRWAFGVGFALWVFLLMKALAETRQDLEQIMTILVMGGGSLYLTWKGIQALEASAPFRRRRAAREAFRNDPTLSESGSRREITPFLLGPDLKQIHLYSWTSRLEDLLELLLQEIFSSSAPPNTCQTVMARCLNLLEAGRAHWVRAQGPGPGCHQNQLTRLGLKDEEVIQFLLVALILLSAMFRLHLLKWGTPPQPFSRKTVGRLRRNWLPFCLLVPTPRTFPPGFPIEMEAASKGGPSDVTVDLQEALASWIFLGKKEHVEASIRYLIQGVVV